ncbi:hypothetical protein BaRGS_00018280, partial [Batillaria attramentaria]
VASAPLKVTPAHSSRQEESSEAPGQGQGVSETTESHRVMYTIKYTDQRPLVLAGNTSRGRSHGSCPAWIHRQQCAKWTTLDIRGFVF